MATIHKYHITSETTVEMPMGAQVLTVQTQHGEPCIWALVDPAAQSETRQNVAFGTGHPVPDDVALAYIGTFQIESGSLVFHVFERK